MSASKDKDKASAGGPPKKPLPAWFNFANAGLSGCCATALVHPMDLMKNRMQMSTEGTTMAKTAAAIYREGITKFYSGLDASFLRQATYTSTRLGIYNQLQSLYREMYPGQQATFLTLSLMAASAGSAGAFIGTPAEVILVRMTSDGRLPPEQRRNYTNLANAFARIVREEGPTTLWRGSVATMGRAAIVNISQLATYSQAKLVIGSKLLAIRYILDSFDAKRCKWTHARLSLAVNIKEGIQLHLLAAMISGLITSITSMPFDIAKTRIQNMKKSSNRTPGMLGVIFKIASTEGTFALWKGFVPYYSRIGPHTIFTFIFNEQFANLYRLHFME